ncbi:MAG: STAS domain-containing protein [Elusimicrobia bacterium]|nr:STAS domain-containing protein [Elusimicrobiota bacterium]
MLNFRTEKDVLVCELDGQMDTVSSLKLEADLMSRVEQARQRVVFDLAKVDYISSSFIRLCLRAAKSAGPGNFSIANAPESARKLFEMVGLSDFCRLPPGGGAAA